MATPAGVPFAIATNDDAVFWSQGDTAGGRITKLPKTGGAPEVVVTTAGALVPTELAVSGRRVDWLAAVSEPRSFSVVGRCVQCRASLDGQLLHADPEDATITAEAPGEREPPIPTSDHGKDAPPVPGCHVARSPSQSPNAALVWAGALALLMLRRARRRRS
jgi:MYXO-CTERM domain-containing protein